MPESRRLGRHFAIGGLVAALSVLVGCAAPGMKLTEKPSDGHSTLEKTKVNLKAITAESITASAAGIGSAVPGELLAVKAEPYRIGPQDILLATVWDHPEITLPLGQYRSDTATGMVVDEKGDLYFPYVGSVKVAGLTATDVRNLLTEKLSSFIRKPQVDIKIISFRAKKIYIGGEVRTPSATNITDVPMTVAEAINRAGGLLPTGDDSRILLNRQGRTWSLDYQGALAAGNGIGQIVLLDGDSLFVPNIQDDPVYMLGEVLRPGITPRPHGRLSLARALADVGGLSGTTADARSIYVLRQGGKPDEVEAFHLDARNPTAMVLADRFALRPRDVVYVDAGTLVRFNRVMSQILPTVSAVNSSAVTGAEFKYWWNRNR